MDTHFSVVGTAHFLKQPMQVKTHTVLASFAITVYPLLEPNQSVQPSTFLAWQSKYILLSIQLNCATKLYKLHITYSIILLQNHIVYCVTW